MLQKIKLEPYLPIPPKKETCFFINKSLLKKIIDKSKFRILLRIGIGLCILSIVIPIATKDDADSWNEVIGVIGTLIGTVATLTTFVLAIFLYDRFGVSQKIVVQQLDTVIKLVEAMESLTINASINFAEPVDGKYRGFTYFLRPFKSGYNFKGIKHYMEVDSKKLVLIGNDNYDAGVKELSKYHKNKWVPKQIRTKMDFLFFPLHVVVEDVDVKEAVRLEFRIDGVKNEDKIVEWLLPGPSLTFKEFNDNMVELMLEISEWISQYTTMEIDWFREP